MGNKVVIVGAGLSGSLLALFLGKRGFNIEIYEKRKNFWRDANNLPRRTIGMSISNRGISAIKKLGIDETFFSSATPTYGRVSHDYSGNKIIQYYSNDESCIFTIERSALNKALLEKLLEYVNVKIFFNHSLLKIDFDNKICTFNCEEDLKEVKYDYLIGADGVFSVCRHEYEKLLKINPQIQSLPIGYKEFVIPFASTDSLALEKNLVNIWSSKENDAILVALPSISHQAFLVNIFCPNEWIDFFKINPNKNRCIDYLSYHFPSVKKILYNINEECFVGKTSKMFQVKSNYWNYKDSVLLLGDAIHAISPFYAMGMNLCFESCMIFDNLLDQLNNNLAEAIQMFQDHRKKDTDAMQELAYENFKNISCSSLSHYNNIWNLERNLNLLLPNQWKPEYHWVAFTNLPLSQVKDRIAKQKAILKIITHYDTGELLDKYRNDPQKTIQFFLEMPN
jgi:kynurenine 3-monooxygenase